MIDGNANQLLSLIPNATGTYSRFELTSTEADSVKSICQYALFYIYQAAKDITKSATNDTEKNDYLNKAKEQLIKGDNYLSFVNYNGKDDSDANRELYSKAASAYALAQAYAKMAWNDPNTLSCDYDGNKAAY